MDSQTALIFASLMALLNGGMLGLMHRSLPPETQPSARDWRIGTLLLAGSCILTAVRDELPAGFVLPLVYGLAFVGVTLYWRANIRFRGKRDSLVMFLPAVIGVAVVYVFVVVAPQPEIRIAFSALVLAGLLLAGGLTLRAHGHGDSVSSRQMLIHLSYVVAASLVMRAVFFVVSLIKPQLVSNVTWIDSLSAVFFAVLPVVGTTAFLLMCLERSRLALQHAADTDDLTGLQNRRSITRAGEELFASARQNGRGFAIAVIDIDHFKQINDRYGHARGDAALCHVAEVLKSTCPEPHLLGRQGGEEFVTLLQVDDESSAVALADALRCAVDAAPFEADGASLSISASIGVGTMAQSDRGYDDVLRRADAALYAAKARGRNRVEIGRP